MEIDESDEIKDHKNRDLTQIKTDDERETERQDQPPITEIFGDPDSDIEESIDDDSLWPPSYTDTPDESASEVVSTEWRFGCTQPSPVPFTGASGVQIELEEDASPMDYFRLMVDNDMMQNIVTETNRYAAEFLRDMELPPRSRFRKWVEVTLGEMWAFFGMVIAMGLIQLEEMEDYWSTHTLYNFSFFRCIMRRDRFCLILSFLHLANNNNQKPRGHPEHQPLFKLEPFISSLKENFKRVFSPGKKIAIDEAMVAWRGYLSFRCYLPDKPSKFGIKIFELCDSQTGYFCNFEFYTGKQDCSQHGATFDVVHRLMTPYLGCGHTLFTDNYYTSPDLYSFLRSNNALACGTMRLGRRYGPPKDMLPKLTKKDTAPKVLTDGTLNLLRFYDKREVNILTTAHDDTVVYTGKTNPITKEPVQKLHAVDDYNKNMGAVDRSDQMVTYNAFRRRTLKWWKKTFFHMLMLGILNSYIVQKVSSKGKTLCHRIFRRELAVQLVEWTPIPMTVSSRAADIGEIPLLRLTARHFPTFILQKPGNKKKNPQRTCVVCSATKKKMFSRFECASCDVGLHVDPCFHLYHTQKDYKRALKRKHSEVEEN